ncbi:DUF3939 domain-containing protein [Sediminibacillus albus]|uniref:DUF3939 domain-containing protein n=1 Tax=Sediminibacillus albus TaxID=407036 RepID=A0A1G8XEE5_9BACI|nr:DUF3939 domain-containing protein [Sediminibacillus albus]SDJ88150.1 Protein of unknown function [Sediminibacillus albus]
MWKKKKNRKKTRQKKQAELPVKPMSISEVRTAVQKYSAELSSEIPLGVLINEDRTIDYDLLAPYLQAKPEDTYYMSRETYELFEEKDKQLAEDIDTVQQAVDNYMDQQKELPIIDGDPHRKVSYFKLEKLGLLTTRPDRPFYLTDEEYLITHKQPT